MSKKRRRYLKTKHRVEKSAKSSRALDTHHLCYQKKNWKRTGNYLRDFWYCRVDIPKNTLHKAIHRVVDNVPVPKAANARAALDQLIRLETYGAIHEWDPIEKRLSLLIALFDCVEQPTADAFRKQLQVVHEYKKAPP